MKDVIAWCQKITIPTYGTGKPEKNPVFLEKRVYQGSSGVVYPHAVIEKIEDEKIDKVYEAVFIENEYLKIMILPELGGRVQRAYDKVRKRDFVYFNQVIKPALVGLTGPWISGGIEFNWPQHHRPSTFAPIDFAIEQNSDGSKTVWVNEVEKMFRTKSMAGFTLYPGHAYLEIKVRFFNRTPFSQTFLWWANPAVKANDFFQSVFPPDVHAVFDHGKRDVSGFPMATSTYYKVNYAPGTDISWYKNIPVPTSYMAVQSDYDFIGCYEHDTKGGMLHVANHHVSTGKKQWTWGNGDFGKAWDRNLTDEDGPYVELMCGAFTDNQPDFSWLNPNEEKSFEEYFMPYSEIGMVKNATKEAAINLEFDKEEIFVKVYATAVYDKASVQVFQNNDLIKDFQIHLSPAKVFNEKFVAKNKFLKEEIKVIVKNGSIELVSYKPEAKEKKENPPPAKAAKKPAEIENNELLYLNGLHLEQYRHATFSPIPYYEEALKRDAGDVRNNNALGLWFLRKGKFNLAEPHFMKAIKRLTQRNPNPIDGEPFFNLGLCKKMQGQIEEAYNNLYRATWNDAWQHAAFFQLARIACIKNDFLDALYLVEKSIMRNYHSHSARHLKTAILRQLGSTGEATQLINESLAIDHFNYGCLFEQHLLSEQTKDKKQSENYLHQFTKLIRNSFNTYVEYALDYANAGMYEQAIRLLRVYEDSGNIDNPLLYYYLGWFHFNLNHKATAEKYYKKAGLFPPDYCFPYKIEDMMALEQAVRLNPEDSKAFYYLGNYWYANRQYEDAIACWEKSISITDKYPTALRNLSLAYYNKLKKFEESILLLEKAFELDIKDARVLMELDQVHKIQNYSCGQRLALLEKHLDLVKQRDDLYLERVTLLNQLGNYEKAAALIAARKFHPWEGGEGKVVYQFLLCHIEMAKAAITEGREKSALELLANTQAYPINLGEGKLYGTQENDIHYLQGCAFEAMGLKKKAKEKFMQATKGIGEPVQAIFYNDPQPDKIFYQGLSWLQLGNEKKANEIFDGLIKFAARHLNDKIEIDYFAVSLPDLLVFDQDLTLKNKLHCQYLTGLGLLGLHKAEDAKIQFNKVLKENINHQGAEVHLKMIDFLERMNKFV